MASLIGLCVWLALAASARADDAPWSDGVSMERRAVAREIFREGNRLLDFPLFAEAAERYREALAIWPHPAFYYNLTIALINLVQPVEAYASLEKAMAYGPDGLGPDNYRQAEEYRRLLEERLGHVAIVCDEPEAEVRLDGRVVFTGPGRYQGVVLPGEHQLVAEKGGHIPETRTLVLSAGERVEEVIAPKRPLRTVTERYLPAWVPWVSLAAGVATAAGGNVLDRRAASELDTFNRGFRADCPRGCESADAPTLAGELDRAKQTRTNALRLYIAGGALTAAAIALLYVNRERVVARPASDDELALTPVAGPGLGGVSARIRF